MKCQTIILITVLTVILFVCEAENFRLNRSSKKRGLHREPPPPPIQSRKKSQVKLEYITQSVDNFDSQNTETYQMRYYRNDEFFKSGGPILIDIGGEWTISPEWLQGGLMYDIARDLNGQMFYTEHRYYGKSRPTNDVSLENLKYLSIEQALADLAHFIEEIRKEPGKKNSKVVVFGCSYAGTMATWFRQKYPNVVVGAKASSAPVLAKADFVEYKEIVGDTIRKYGGKKCYDRINNAFKETEKLAANGDWKKLKKTFNICNNFDGNNQLDVWSFFAWMGYGFDGAVQYYEDGGLEDECKSFLNIKAESDMEAYAEYITGDSRWCNDVEFQTLIDYYGTTKWTSESVKWEDRQWTYQTCTTFGYFQTSGSPHQPFGSNFPVNFDFQKCADFFSPDQFTPQSVQLNINRTNVIYGGFDPAVKNVYFTHGEIDPWRAVGVQQDLNPDSPSDTIPGAAHCPDLYSISRSDSPELIAVKNRVKKLVNQWLS